MRNVFRLSKFLYHYPTFRHSGHPENFIGWQFLEYVASFFRRRQRIKERTRGIADRRTFEMAQVPKRQDSDKGIPRDEKRCALKSSVARYKKLKDLNPSDFLNQKVQVFQSASKIYNNID